MASVGFQTHLRFSGCLNFASNSNHIPHRRLLASFQSQPQQQQQQQQQTKKHLPRLLVSKSGITINTTTSSSSTSIKGWAEFAEKVSGEWDGYGADFSKEGEPIELPETVVPEAFREWEVQVFDWQTQCPTLALPHPQFNLSYKLIRLLPTVGCEADAATRYSILERNINPELDDDDAMAMAFAYQSSGCYVAVWPDHSGSRDGRVLELEHCLVDPRDKESRVRVIQKVRVVQGGGEQMKMQLEAIKVFCEQWYGPFRNGDQLGGCAIRDSAFASSPALKSSRISGLWQDIHRAIATFPSHADTPAMNIKELLEDDTVAASVLRSRDGNTQILLPKQLWCSSNHQQGREDGETWFEVGWLLDEGLAITSTCIFSSQANLKASLLMV